MKKLTSLVALVLSIVLPVLAVAEEPAATPEPVPAEEILAYTRSRAGNFLRAFLYRGLECR